MRAIFNLAMKDLRVLLRDKMGLFWVAVFPLLMALFFGAIFGSEGSGARNLRIAIVKEGVSPVGQMFYDELKKSEVLNVREVPRDSAKLLVSRGSLVAYVEFIGGGADPFSLFGENEGSVEVGIDPSRRAEAGYLNGLISQAYYKLLQGSMMNRQSWKEKILSQQDALDSLARSGDEKGIAISQLYANLDRFLGSLSEVDSLAQDSTGEGSSAFGQVKIDFEEITVNAARPGSSFEITFPQALQWAMVGCAAAFAISIVTERTRGTFSRLQLAPISRVQILAGKGLACFMTSAGVSIILILIGVLIFKVRIASPLGMLAAIASSAFCFVGLMMMMSVMGKTEASVSGSGWGILMIFSMTGGGMVPLMVMPKWMLSVSNFSPIKWSIYSAEGAIWRGFGWQEMLTPISILLAIGTVGFFAGVWILKRSDG